ncbi:hypothetical protein I1E95_06005 [Synechococcus sp. CBW1107]|uniref:Ycf66 family protein n=1 Tax=Synechococcus sp. CBW1107 TaxID=2789857 RepID=UPI0018CF0EE0|nr:Ycf66 family protein [Synechococcus sp. CBW1107]QPN57638.1 hypothetical protein I1E95_06005 [Synechococcus sp. CBW1107]
MLATLGGSLALLAGLLVLLLPLLVPELSRPRDSVWGALVLILGLVLVTSADRLSGAPMLAVLCGGLLIGRLSVEVGLGRWRQLSCDEQVRLTGVERWRTSLQQLAAALMRLISLAGSTLGGLLTWLQERRDASAKARETSKRWVRPEPGATDTAEVSETETPEEASEPEEPISSDASDEEVTTVESFAEIEQLIEQAGAASPGADQGGSSQDQAEAEATPASDGAAGGGEEPPGESTADRDHEDTPLETQPPADPTPTDAEPTPTDEEVSPGSP